MTNRPTYRQTDRPTDRQTDRPTDRQIDRWTNRQTDRQTDRLIERQTNRPTDRQTDRYTVFIYTIYIFYLYVTVNLRNSGSFLRASSAYFRAPSAAPPSGSFFGDLQLHRQHDKLQDPNSKVCAWKCVKKNKIRINIKRRFFLQTLRLQWRECFYI